MFIAINFNEDTRRRLVVFRDDLQTSSMSGNFSLPENIHLTLAFLGECDAEQTAAAKAVMGEIDFQLFEIRVERIGHFKRQGGDIWWAGIKGTAPLTGLRQRLTEGLGLQGFKLDTRKFSPHVTLGREIMTKASPWQIEAFGETVTKIDLMKSERIRGKLTYTAVYTKGT